MGGTKVAADNPDIARLISERFNFVMWTAGALGEMRTLAVLDQVRILQAQKNLDFDRRREPTVTASAFWAGVDSQAKARRPGCYQAHSLLRTSSLCDAPDADRQRPL